MTRLKNHIERPEWGANPKMGVAEAILLASNGACDFRQHVYAPGQSRLEDSFYRPDTKKGVEQ